MLDKLGMIQHVHLSIKSVFLYKNERFNYRFNLGLFLLSGISNTPISTVSISITVTRGRDAQQVLMWTIAAMTTITTGAHAVDRLPDTQAYL